MAQSLADFSKGTVVPKYLVVEMLHSRKTTSLWLALGLAVWFFGWICISFKLQNWWFALPAFAPIVFSDLICRKAFPWRATGMITLKDDTMIIQRDDRTETIAYKELRQIGLWTHVATFTSNTRLPQYSMIAAFRVRVGGTELEFHVLNEMYLTAGDELKFMEPPPTFGSLMLRACELNKIRAKTGTGRNWSDWLKA